MSKTGRSFFFTRVNAVLCLAFLAAKPSVAGLAPLIESVRRGDIKSVDEFLKSLPEEHRRHFVVGYEGRGLGFASPEFPRLIGFDPAEASYLALQSTSTGARGDVIEIIEWNRSTRRFEFSEIDFRRENKVETDPPLCMRCHAGAPLWDTYVGWPGFMGSAQIAGLKSENLPNLKEFEYWKRFLGNGAQSSRAQSFDLSIAGLDSMKIQTEFERRNSLLNRSINLSNAKRLADKLEKTPEFYERYAPILLLGMTGVEEAWKWLEPPNRDALLEKQKSQITTLSQRYDEIRKIRQKQYGIVDEAGVGYLGAPFTLGLIAQSQLKLLPEVFLVLEDVLGLNPKEFETVFSTRATYAYSDGGSGNLDHLWVEVARRLLDKYPAWREVFEIKPLATDYARFTRIAYDELYLIGKKYPLWGISDPNEKTRVAKVVARAFELFKNRLADCESPLSKTVH